ncbi:hypothetical protein BMF94_6435 [Rhodotorula taiwanensis]|uniref:Uncharacterized protein n=1 Tax=Rhodotorula taiwanensis TaxID=741276 RepID=A0A2S5B1H6_9BASI|nr:hypothetical protein BMF94_6435 [Rhodotorula taiwanensis]
MAQPTPDLEKNETMHYEGRDVQRTITPGGHPIDYSQTPLPQFHRKLANPAPLGLMSFGTGFFLTCFLTLHARGVKTPNVVVPVLMLYGGIAQWITGLVEMFSGNTFGATVFGSYGAFNMTYAALYLPAFGVIQAYTLADGSISPELNQAIGLYLIVWMMVTIMFMFAALRTTAAVFATLTFTALTFLLLAINEFTGNDAARIVGGVFGLVASASSWWAAASALWVPDTTFGALQVSPIGMARR